MRLAFRRFLADETGQDLLEYALLAAFIALASFAGLEAIQAALRLTYTSWSSATQRCWQMPAPGAGGGC